MLLMSTFLMKNLATHLPIRHRILGAIVLLKNIDDFGVVDISGVGSSSSLQRIQARKLGRRRLSSPVQMYRAVKKSWSWYPQDNPVDEDVDVKAIACGTPGFNGADLANLVNIAAVKAAVDGDEKLTAGQSEFEKDRVLVGRKTMLISENSIKLTAYLESGHAIVALNTEGAHPIHKATIMPRGSALGMVIQLPSNEETSLSKKQLLARLDVCMGGRVAEELVFGQGHVATGASSDFNQARELAQYMGTVCGMSDAISPVHIKENPGPDMQSCVDAEVVKLLRDAYDRVKTLLKKHEKALHALANELLENETLNSEDIKRVLSPHPEENQQTIEQQGQEADLVLA